MGLLVNGKWQDKWYDTEEHGGAFEREAAQLRHWVTADGSPGPNSDKHFPAESGRYHLYVSYACPWAHRALILRQLKDLTQHIDVSVVATDMLSDGWTFDETKGSTGDKLYGMQFLRELYLKNSASYSGRVTVPVLWDTQTQTIVSNESAEIIRMLNSAFNEITDNNVDYYPQALQATINETNELVYNTVNNGVYKAGFATQQDVYDTAYDELFNTLDELDQRLGQQRYLAGQAITEADWRLFTTLIRFDAVYHGHFKCNCQKISEFKHLANYVRELYQVPTIADTVHFDHIKRHYYASHKTINPTQIIPQGPAEDFNQPHNRQLIV